MVDRDSFDTSRLYGAFADQNDVVTEASILALGSIAIMHRDGVDRESDEAVAKYIQNAYGWKRVFVLRGMKEYSATMRVPEDE